LTKKGEWVSEMARTCPFQCQKSRLDVLPFVIAMCSVVDDVRNADGDKENKCFVFSQVPIFFCRFPAFSSLWFGISGMQAKKTAKKELRSEKSQKKTQQARRSHLPPSLNNGKRRNMLVRYIYLLSMSAGGY